MILPLLRRHVRPWVPLASTRSPHMHEWGVQRLQPSLMPTAIRIASSSSRSPKAEIGRAFSQSPEWGSIAAFNLAERCLEFVSRAIQLLQQPLDHSRQIDA